MGPEEYNTHQSTWKGVRDCYGVSITERIPSQGFSGATDAVEVECWCRLPDLSKKGRSCLSEAVQVVGQLRHFRGADLDLRESQVLESGNSAFSLPRHQAIEATLDHFHLHNSVSHKMAINCLTILISAMEDLCEEWLIGVLGVASCLPSRAQKETYIAIHKQYMVNIAKIEEKAANQCQTIAPTVLFRP
ncbi:hypothetical protein B0H14DRAFT_2655165 [Mycena olivaceomarginata]|nr:hypothetical protein B0H14DRAFT_2655165 [Mycena olivaceomarginata]